VGHRRPDQVRPLAPGPGRRDVAAPPEHGLVTRGQFGRHETEFDERSDAEIQVGVDYLVHVREGVPDPASAVEFVRTVDPDPVAEQAMATDVPEPDVALDQGQRVLVVAA
jgi:hypothetical protein